MVVGFLTFRSDRVVVLFLIFHIRRFLPELVVFFLGHFRDHNLPPDFLNRVVGEGGLDHRHFRSNTLVPVVMGFPELLVCNYRSELGCHGSPFLYAFWGKMPGLESVVGDVGAHLHSFMMAGVDRMSLKRYEIMTTCNPCLPISGWHNGVLPPFCINIFG